MRAWGGSAVVVGLAVLVVMNVIPPAQAADDRVPASASILTVGSSDQMKMRNLLTAMLLDDPHTMAVLARVYDVRPALMRLLVVGSNAIAVVAVSVGAAIVR